MAAAGGCGAETRGSGVEHCLQARALRSWLGVDARRSGPAFLSEALGRADLLLAPSQVPRGLLRQAWCRPRHASASPAGRRQTVSGTRVPSDEMRFGFVGQVKAHKGVTAARRLVTAHGPAPAPADPLRLGGR